MTDAAGEVAGIQTPLGPARAHLWTPEKAPAGRIVLGHGAGGGIGAPDLVAVRDLAVAAGWQVVLVEQPWRVAGKKVAAAPPKLDVGWLAVLQALTARPEWKRRKQVPLVVGGRSAGARVACRTAAGLGARAVCALAFPLHPPGKPERSRAEELARPGAVGIDVLVVQGDRDPFGSGADIQALDLPGVVVSRVEGDHSLKKTGPVAGAVAARLADWSESP
jgi:predicted alpha/beta-hydrolase family hydrolase